MKKKITVVEWIGWSEIEKYPKSPLGFLGGFFNWRESGMRWKDYLAAIPAEARPYAEALRKEVVATGKRITGEQHQYGSKGVPVFSDGTVATFSYRGWGDIMAAIWSEEENKDYNYMDFYM